MPLSVSDASEEMTSQAMFLVGVQSRLFVRIWSAHLKTDTKIETLQKMEHFSRQGASQKIRVINLSRIQFGLALGFRCFFFAELRNV